MIVDHQAAELKIVFQRKLNPQDYFSTINILVDIFNSAWFPNGGVCSRIVPPQPRLWLKWASQRTCWAAWEAGGELNNNWSEYKKMLLTTFKSVKWISHHILRWARICSPELCREWPLLRGTWSWWTWNSNKRFSAKISFVKNNNQERRRWTSRWREREWARRRRCGSSRWSWRGPTGRSPNQVSTEIENWVEIKNRKVERQSWKVGI